jgi:anti-sigma factor RsiW
MGDSIHYKGMNHISDHNLERYHLGMVTGEAELALLEEHYPACPECAERVEELASYVDAIRAAIVEGGLDSIRRDREHRPVSHLPRSR